MRQPSNLAALRAAWRAANDVATGTGPSWSLTNAATPKLYVSGVIGGYDLDAQEFVKAVHALDAQAIDLHVNSPGGLVWDAMTMYQALKSHPATVTAYVDGLAASAASFLIQAADHRVMATGSRAMIHDAQVVAIGSPAEVREMADLGDALSDDIASIYAERAGGKPAEWRTAMRATSWYSAQEAVDAGLADRMTGNPKKTSGTNLAARTLRARAAVALEGVSK